MNPDDAAVLAAQKTALHAAMQPLLDPVMLALTCAPLVIGGLIFYVRWRQYSRMKAMAKTTAAKLNATADDLAATAERQKMMIQLLTEIRDRLPPKA
jgi:hypothetical protein